MMDLRDHIDRRALVSLIEADVEKYCREAFPSEHRNHLGASGIADPCAAKSWGTFRWLKLEQHEGRMRRLFERGHLEESRFVKILKGIGFDIRELDESGKQYKISGVNGHFGGSLDGMAKAPARYDISDDIIFINEFKTHGENSFTKLAGKKDKATGRRIGGEGVRMSKPVHYGQICSYGRAYDFSFALYVAVNKNTDELYWEIVELDYRHADDLFRKADSVINSQVQPAKIAQVETFFQCKTCHFSGICFRGELPEKNCRSCVYAFPVANGQWECNRPVEPIGEGAGELLSAETIKIGCDSWKAIING